MKDLAEALKKTPKPDLRVDQFKQSLRRDLMAASRLERVGRSYKWAFLGATFTTGVLVAMLALMILNPNVADSLHQRWVSGSDQERSTPEGGVANHEKRLTRDSRAPVGSQSGYFEPGRNATSYPARMGGDRTNTWTSGQLQPYINPDADKDYIEKLYNQDFSKSPGEIRPTQKEKLMVLREYELENGERVWIYTEIPKVPDEDTLNTF